MYSGLDMHVAKVGGRSARSRPRAPNDFYRTPANVTEALLSVESFDNRIWEPCIGDGALSSVLTDHGHVVRGSDIALGTDFLEYSCLAEDTIVTNPPFGIAADIVRHVIQLRPKKCALLLRAGFWHSSARAAMFKEWTPARVWALGWRPNFGYKGSPVMDVIWCVWERGKRGRARYGILERLKGV